MTKKGYMPKLLAVLVGAILCLCAATVALTFKSTSASAETLDPAMKLSLDTIDEFSTQGYKIEVASAENQSKEHPYDDATDPYDYVITVVDKTSSWWNPRNGGLYFNENSHLAVWNIKTPSGKKVTGGGDYKWSKIYTTSSTDPSIASFTENNNEKIIYPDTGDRAENGSDWKCGETVMKFSFKEGSGNNTCTEHGERVPCTCWIDGDGQGEVLTGMTLRVLYRVVHVEDHQFAFTGARADENDDKTGVWLTFGADVLGVSKADETWSHAERWSDDPDPTQCFIKVNKYFFDKIYFLEDYDLKAGAPTEQQLTGRDLYTLMTGDNIAEGKLVFQTEVRYDHIELHKRSRAADEASWSRVNYETGDAFYLAEGLMMLGKDGNGNWAAAQEGGSKNVLKAAQFYYYDADLGWSIDQYDMGVSVDKKTALVEIGQTATVTANVVTGAFLQGGDVAVTWSSSDEAIATVANGVVTGVATGEATITAAIANGSAATCKVTVVRNDQVEKVELNKKTVTLYTAGTEEETSATLVATVTGGSALTKVVTWSSSDESVATVDQNGKVTAVAEGTCTITATAEDGETKATASVTVFEGEEEDPNKPGTGDNDPTKPGTGDNDNQGDDKGDGKKKGCGGSVAATSTMAGAVLLMGVTAIFVARKKAENK